MSTVLFHRDFRGFRGGHLKVFHYFEHVRTCGRHAARIRFTEGSAWDESNPWAARREAVVASDEEVRADVLFLGARDWLALEPAARAAPPAPVIALIQGPRHAEPEDWRHPLLTHPAIRICMSEEVREAVLGSGRATGPVITIPAAVDLGELPAGRPRADRDLACLVLAVKDRGLGAEVADAVARAGHEARLVDRRIPRSDLLDLMARARVAVHLPHPVEGVYLPAIESMALGTVVVCPDCVGNRSYARDGKTCLMPERTGPAIAAAALGALCATEAELRPMLAAALAQARERDLATERARFLAVLDDVGALWETVTEG